MKTWLKRFLLLLVVLVAAFLIWPSPVDPVAFEPPEALSMEGVLAPNEKLDQAVLPQGSSRLAGSEDVAVDAEGRIVGGLADGRIVRLYPDGSVEEWADTGGRPLGLAFDPQGRLVVADAVKGLLAVSGDGEVSVLATEADGLAFGFADDVDVAADGTIYFSDASHRYTQMEYKLDLLETRPNGRLLKYEPETGEVTTLLDNLYFANGVAVDPLERFVLVNETWAYRVKRLWLAGDRAGEAEVFATNLPGFPDGIARDRQGRFWVALPTPRNADLDRLHSYPWLKSLMAKLPDPLQPQPMRYGMVLALDDSGRILTSLQDTDGSRLHYITSVEPHGDRLYFGSLYANTIGWLPMEKAGL